MMFDLIERIKQRFAKAETFPEADKLADSLKRLDTLEDFQLFRWWIKALYADAAKDIVNAPSAVVDHIRGRMAAYDQLFQLTSQRGIEEIRREPEQITEIFNSNQQIKGFAGNTDSEFTL